MKKKQEQQNKILNIKKENWKQFTLILLAIIAINIISGFVFHRFDLTKEKRFTLSASTKNMLKNLDDVVYVKVYLYGKNLPADFQELSLKTRELLDEMRAYSDNIEYEFIDPTKGKSGAELKAIYGELYQKGLRPQAIQSMESDGVSTHYIVPGALVCYQSFEVPVQLADADEGLLTQREEIINYSMEKLEYNMSNTIRRITHQQNAKVAFLKGHGELSNIDVFKAAVAIAQFYEVDSVILDNKISSIFDIEVKDSISGDYRIKGNKYDLLIIAKPTIPFGDYEKYLLDQFVMRGGRLLWYVDPVMAEIDSMYNYPEMPCLPRDLNLDDMFFRYGVRFNTNLLQDLNALAIPVSSGEQVAGQNQYKLIPFYYFPIITPYAKHPIVNNLSLLRSEFISSIDTIGAGNSGVKKTILLTTSENTKVVNTPAIISLEVLKRRADMLQFNKQYLPVSVLVEGTFHSLYTDLQGEHIKELGLISESRPTKMVFVADGDMIKNQLGDNFIYPLGYDRYTNTAFANKNFLLNAVNYLCDDEEILQVRSKDFKMRLLDKNKILKQRTFWQCLNMIVPLLMIILLGIGLYTTRNLTYKKKTNYEK
ncbi:MAG: gliding motility-associated ABC transporter substrate-binding protein GldG [Bacteroidales bacterium]|nr:gliding motility-associated ABC transporter substrate-binding protein GldG [Bacteroidales bacterium]MCR5554153.1 gliding motility-associated ABC transporter substrate-binding protein GldG [Bacteroidales bacterium]